MKKSGNLEGFVQLVALATVPEAGTFHFKPVHNADRVCGGSNFFLIISKFAANRLLTAEFRERVPDRDYSTLDAVIQRAGVLAETAGISSP